MLLQLIKSQLEEKTSEDAQDLDRKFFPHTKSLRGFPPKGTVCSEILLCMAELTDCKAEFDRQQLPWLTVLNWSQVWCCTPIIPALWEDHKFNASLGSLASSVSRSNGLKRDWKCSSVLQCLAGMCKGQSPIPRKMKEKVNMWETTTTKVQGSNISKSRKESAQRLHSVTDVLALRFLQLRSHYPDFFPICLCLDFKHTEGSLLQASLLFAIHRARKPTPGSSTGKDNEVNERWSWESGSMMKFL